MSIQWFHISLALLACFALVLTSKTPRGWMWVAALAASYVVSVVYAQAPKPVGMWSPLPPSITFLCDSVLALFIHRVHKQRWEWMGLFVPAVLMSLLSFIQTIALLTGSPPPLSTLMYGSLLEAINAICLLLIGGIGAVDLIDGRLHSPRFHGSNLASIAHTARARTTASKDRWHWHG